MQTNRTIFLLLIALFITLNASSQELLWNHSSLSVSKHFDNGFYLQNNTHNTIKVIIKHLNNEICNSTIIAKQETKFVFPIEEVSRNYTNNTTLSVYYDTECYEIDLAFLNRIATNRYRAAKEKRDLKLAFRAIFSGAEAITPKDWWIHKRAKEGKAFMDGIDSYEDFKKNGIDDTFINYAKAKIESESYRGISNELTGSERLGSIVNNLHKMSDLVNSEIEFQTADIEEAAKLSFTFIDNNPIYEYGINFDNGFSHAIDPDGDSISNRFDDCPRVFGTKEYDGCTRETFVQKRKEKKRIKKANRKRGYPSTILDVHYYIANYSQSNNSEFNSNSFAERGFDLALKVPILIHQISKGLKSSFLITGTYRTNKFNYKQSQEEQINLFNQNEVYISLGYGLLFGANSRTKVIIEPIYGFQIYNNLSSGEFTLGGNEVEEDFFIKQDSKSNINAYKGLMLRLIFIGSAEYSKSSSLSSASIPIGLNFGITQFNNSPIIVNQNYSTNLLLEDGSVFNYPDKQLYLNMGISLNF